MCRQPSTHASPLPPGAHISLFAQECCSEFISFVTSEAVDHCQAEKRKTVNGDDLIFAFESLGFDPYVQPLRLFLQRQRELGTKSAAGGGAGGATASGALSS